jgi:hypothetical protein
MRPAPDAREDGRRSMSDVALEALAAAWRSARQETTVAYHQWAGAPAARRSVAYAVFLAAAEREERAEAAYVAAARRAAGS